MVESIYSFRLPGGTRAFPAEYRDRKLFWQWAAPALRYSTMLEF